MTEEEFLKEHPKGFVGYVQVGNRGVKRYFTDKAEYEAYLDRTWESGHDLSCSILRKE